MTKTYTKKTLAKSLEMSEGLLAMEVNIAGLAEKYGKVEGIVRRIYTEADRQAIIKSRRSRNLKTPSK